MTTSLYNPHTLRNNFLKKKKKNQAETWHKKVWFGKGWDAEWFYKVSLKSVLSFFLLFLQKTTTLVLVPLLVLLIFAES